MELETLLFLRLNERNVSLSPLAQSFSHEKAQQRSGNLPRHNDAPGPPEGGYVVFFLCSSKKVVDMTSSTTLNSSAIQWKT